MQCFIHINKTRISVTKSFILSGEHSTEYTGHINEITMFPRLIGICSPMTKTRFIAQRLLPQLSPLAKAYSTRDNDFFGGPPRNRQFQPNRDRNSYNSNNRFGGGGGGGGGYNRRPSQFSGSGFAGENLSSPRWEELTLTEVKKNFHVPHELTQNRSAEEVAKYRQEHSMTVSAEAPNPVQSFEELQVPKELAAMIKQKQFTKVTPIQAQGWPIALSGSDMVGIAQTG